MKILLIVIIILLLLALYVIFENFFMLTVRREKLGSGIKVVQVSDLHKKRFGTDNERLIRKVRAEKPDIIILSGDLISRNETDFSSADFVLKGLCETAPVYMIYGNHEQSIHKENKRIFKKILMKNRQILLKNGCAELTVKGRTLKIYGLLEDYGVYKKNGGYRGLDVIEKKDLDRLLGPCPEGEVLLIAHNPFFGKEYAEWGAKYTFSGHVHGGSVRLFGKALLSPERKFFPKYAKGVYDFDGKKLLVSAGLGKIRLFDPPEIVVYEI